MPQSETLRIFLEEDPPAGIRLAAARGLVPLPPDEMLRLLVHLGKDNNPEVSRQAGATLETWPEEKLILQLRSEQCSAEVLEYFAASSPSPALQEAVIANTAAPASAIESLARRVSAPLVEAILDNRVRLLEWPAILEAVRNNPAGTPQIGRLIREIETEFFAGKNQEYSVESDRPEPVETVPETALPYETADFDLALEGLPLDPEEREAALSARIVQMTVPQKLKLALLGTRETRALLIRDSNRGVVRSVLQSPKLSDSEIEAFATMRNVSDEVLREIGSSRKWTKNYTVVQSLVRNPKTPPLISQRLLFRLHTRELGLIARDRGIPEAVRRNAQRVFSQRSAAGSLR